MKKDLARFLTCLVTKRIDQEGKAKMCMSNMECESLENAFVNERFDSIDSFINRKMTGREPSPLTEFELKLFDWLSSDTGGKLLNEVMRDCAKARAKELLSIVVREQARLADMDAETRAKCAIRRTGIDFTLGRNKVLAKILTWEDVKNIMDIIYDMSPMIPTQDWEIYAEFQNMEGFCTEVLKRLESKEYGGKDAETGIVRD